MHVEPNRGYALHSFDEFSTLRSIIIGSPVGANHPEIDVSFEHFFQPPQDPELRRRAVGPVPQAVIDEIEEDIATFALVLRDFGVEVRRPEPWDSTLPVGTPFWSSRQLYSLMPRDSLLVFGNLMIETPSPCRSRYFETFPFRKLIDEYVQRGAHVIAAPKPMLTVASFGRGALREIEVIFDAANCVRLGLDVFIDINRTANLRAHQWLTTTLQGFVDKRIQVHPMSIGRDHVDVTLIPLRPGMILVDPVKARPDNLPPQFASWDRIIVDEVMPVRDYGLPYPLASNDGIGRNVLMLDRETVIVDEIQLPLMRALEKRHFTVVPLRYRHGRTLGGSWHCITLDTNRDGELVSYF